MRWLRAAISTLAVGERQDHGRGVEATRRACHPRPDGWRVIGSTPVDAGRQSMADKSNAAGAAVGKAPVAGEPGRIRNVVLVGHPGAGKTTLVEALLVATATIPRAGRVEDGTTVSDFDEAEVRQQRSISLAVAPFEHAGVKVNLIDTPGYADFTGHLRAGLRAADAALFVVSAADGIDGTTQMIWDECAAVGMPRAVVITRLDSPRANFEDTLAACQSAFGESVLPLYLPLHAA